MTPNIVMNPNRVGAPATLGDPQEAAPPRRTPEDGVLAELDAVVRKSRRRSPLRRALHGAGGLFARLLERAVPARPSRSDPPPEIRFPFF